MAKPTQNPAELIDAAIESLTKAKAALGGKAAPAKSEESETSTVDIPSAKEIKKLDKKGVTELCERLSIETKGKKEADLRATLTLLSKHAAGDDLSEEDAKKLAEGLDLKVSKKHKENLKNINDYIQADSTEEESEDGEEEDSESESDDEDSENDESDDDSEEEESDDDESDDESDTEEDDDDSDDEDSEEEDSEESEEESEDDESDEDEESEDEDEDEESEDDESDEDEESEDEDEDEESEDEDSDDEEEEVSEKDQKKRLAAYNKVAKKALKSYEKLVEQLTDDEGDVAKWGEPYVKDENFYCCGLPLEDVKHNKKEAGKCQVTGTIYVQDKKGNLVPVEE